MPATPPCVALTGATGFVGRHLLAQLRLSGCSVRVLARDASRLPPIDSKVHTVKGGLFDDNAIAALVDGADAVIHVVGIIMEKPRRGQTFERVHTSGTERLLATATKAGVRRWVQMSAIGARPNAVSRYHLTKWHAEQAVRDSGMAYTIFRPSVIHGPDGEFMQMVKGFCCGPFPPFMPYFGAGLLGRGGAGSLQPVWVEDVAHCFANAVTNDRSIGETYPLGGPDRYTWPALYQTCQKHLPKAKENRKPLAIPVWYANLIAAMPGAPFNRDQVIMSQEDAVCESAKARETFGREFAEFESTFAGYADQI